MLIWTVLQVKSGLISFKRRKMGYERITINGIGSTSLPWASLGASGARFVRVNVPVTLRDRIICSSRLNRVLIRLGVGMHDSDLSWASAGVPGAVAPGGAGAVAPASSCR